MNVQLLQHTPNPEQAVATAARLCYSAADIQALQESIAYSASTDTFIRKILSLGHLSVMEHASFTFGIEGISRVTSHQLVRHRVASYSQQSQRYVKAGDMPTVVCPDSINDFESRRIFGQAIAAVWAAYQSLVDMGIPPEDARYLLPNATETKIIVTMNARELLHFFKHRCCDRAQWEIRAMANAMLRICQEVAPTIFEQAGAACVSGPCPEGAMTCGKPKR